MDINAIKLRHRHQQQLLELKQRQEVEELKLLARKRSAKIEPSLIPEEPVLRARKPIRADVLNWLKERKKGTQFTPLEIARFLNRDHSSVSATLVKMSAENIVQLMQGRPRGMHSFWEVL